MKRKEPIDLNTAIRAADAAAENFFGGSSRVRHIGSGAFGAVFEASAKNMKIAVKTVADKEKARREAEELRFLASVSEIKTPRVFFCEEYAGLGCIGMEFIEGVCAYKNPRVYLHGRKRREAFASSVAEWVHALQSVKNGRFGPLSSPQALRWTDIYRPRADRIMAGARSSSDRRIIRLLPLMEELYAAFGAIFARPPEEATLVHGDLCPMNMLVDPATLELKAFIDPLDTAWADGEYELFQLFCQSGEYFRLYETYKSRFPVSDNVDIKCVFYAVFAEAELFLDTGIFLSDVVKRLKRRAKRVLTEFKRR